MECESHRRVVQDLKNRVSDAEQKIIEAERLRKKMHNTILVLAALHLIRPVFHI